ncbi:polymer-forming cytoskeletal protein [Patescibacteria group bacterium]|nr:polymer-forming cytoskeletal protein [Patescibacteria group bacterium]
MFVKDSKIKPEDAETIIGTGVKVEGTFNAFGDVIIKGQLVGSLSTENDLFLRSSGIIEANIRAKNASIAGELKGNLTVDEKIELAATAKVSGDIYCRVLAIEEGAILNGKCKVGGQGPVGIKEKKKESKTEEE